MQTKLTIYSKPSDNMPIFYWICNYRKGCKACEVHVPICTTTKSLGFKRYRRILLGLCVLQDVHIWDPAIEIEGANT